MQIWFPLKRREKSVLGSSKCLRCTVGFPFYVGVKCRKNYVNLYTLTFGGWKERNAVREFEKSLEVEKGSKVGNEKEEMFQKIKALRSGWKNVMLENRQVTFFSSQIPHELHIILSDQHEHGQF